MLWTFERFLPSLLVSLRSVARSAAFCNRRYRMFLRMMFCSFYLGLHSLFLFLIPFPYSRSLIPFLNPCSLIPVGWYRSLIRSLIVDFLTIVFYIGSWMILCSVFYGFGFNTLQLSNLIYSFGCTTSREENYRLSFKIIITSQNIRLQTNSGFFLLCEFILTITIQCESNENEYEIFLRVFVSIYISDSSTIHWLVHE